MGNAARQYTGYYTLTDWEQWQDNWELINGFPYSMSPAPSLQHQRVSKKLIQKLDDQLENCKHCEAFLPIDWQISEDTVVQPDILVTCKESKGKRLLTVPSAIFEILSPSTEKKDRTTKFELYQEQGVRWYILVNPDEEKVEVYKLDSNGEYQIQSLTGIILFDFDGCKVELDFNGIW